MIGGILRNGREPSESALKNTVVTIKSLFKYLHDYGLRNGRNPTLVIDAPRVKPKQNDWLRTDEDEALLAASMNQDEAAIISYSTRRCAKSASVRAHSANCSRAGSTGDTARRSRSSTASACRG